MKTSLIINPQAFRAELYKCFFWYRTFVINGKKFISVPSYVDSDFILSFFDVNSTDEHPEIDPRDYHKLPLRESVYNHRFSANNCVALRSTAVEDYYGYFFVECSIIEREMKKIIPNQNPAA